MGLALRDLAFSFKGTFAQAWKRHKKPRFAGFSLQFAVILSFRLSGEDDFAEGHVPVGVGGGFLGPAGVDEHHHRVDDAIGLVELEGETSGSAGRDIVLSAVITVIEPIVGGEGAIVLGFVLD